MTLTVVGIGADGWAGLAGEARRALADAPLIVGSRRQLAMLPAGVGGARLGWPSPIWPLVDDLAIGLHGRAAVLASGDPMLHGVGSTLIDAGGINRVRVLPHPSAFALACARLGWPEAEVELVSLVAQEVASMIGWLQPGRRIVAYVTGVDGAARVARVLCDHGCGASRFTVLEQLGGPGESRLDTTAAEAVAHRADPLHVVAVTVSGGPGHARTPGRPDAAFASDGQITKSHVRAITLAALGPLPGELLWDVGSGSGSVAIEWLRAESSTAAIAIERRADRAERIAQNAWALGVPSLGVVVGTAPAALAALRRPEAIFIGGGVTTPGLVEACWAALREGGRIVANTVTLEGGQVVAAARRSRGGTLARIEIAEAAPVGAFTSWRPRISVVQWSASKPAGVESATGESRAR